MTPVWINQENFDALHSAYKALPWYKKLFFPSNLKKVLVSSIGFNTPKKLWTLYDAYFNYPSWFGRYFQCVKDFAASSTTRLLAPLAQAGLLIDSKGEDNFYRLISCNEKEQKHIFYILYHYPRLFHRALNAQSDFNRIFVTYREELMLGKLTTMVIDYGLIQGVEHALNPLNPQGKGAVWLHDIKQWGFTNPLYRSHIDSMIQARRINNKEQVTYHVNALLNALKGNEPALASLAMIMDAKVDRLMQILLDEHQNQWLEIQAHTLTKINKHITDFISSLDGGDSVHRCWVALSACDVQIRKLSRIYTGSEQKHAWDKIRTDLLKIIERLTHHRNYNELKNALKNEVLNNQPMTLSATLFSFAPLLRRMVAEDWLNQPEKIELARQSKLLVFAVSLLATVDESCSYGSHNKQSVVQSKFFKIIFDLVTFYLIPEDPADVQRKEELRQATNHALTQAACTYLHGLSLNFSSLPEEKEQGVFRDAPVDLVLEETTEEHQVLSLYAPFESLEEAKEEPSAYEYVVQTYQGNPTYRLDCLVRAIALVIEQATQDGMNRAETDFLWYMINQRMNVLTHSLAFRTVFASKYTLELHQQLTQQLNPMHPYLALVTAYGALHLVPKVAEKEKNHYLAQAMQVMTLLKCHMPYPVPDAFTRHPLWTQVLTQCQEKTVPLSEFVRGGMSPRELKRIQLMPLTSTQEYFKNLYYQALFFKQCQVLVADYEHFIAKLYTTSLTNEDFLDSANHPPIPFTLQNHKHMRRQIELYYQGNEEFYFYGLAKAAYPLNVQAVKTTLGLSMFSTAVTKLEVRHYLERIKNPSEVDLGACQKKGILSEDGQQKITAIHEPEFLLVMDYQRIHSSHVLSDVYQKIKETHQSESDRLSQLYQFFNHLLQVGYMPLPLNLLQEELQSAVPLHAQARSCLLKSLNKWVDNYHIDSQHPLFISSLPSFKKMINQGKTGLKDCNDKKQHLALITELHLLEQGIKNQSAYLRSRSLITKAQAHLPVGNKILRQEVYQFLVDKPSPIIKSLLFARSELNEFLASLHADIDVETQAKSIRYIVRYPCLTSQREIPPVLGVSSLSYQVIRKAYGELPIQNILDRLIQNLNDHGGATLFTLIKNELNDNAQNFGNIIERALSCSEASPYLDPSRYVWAKHANELYSYYRGQPMPVQQDKQSKESSTILTDVETLWKKQPWQKEYGFAQTPKLEPHVQEVLRMQALLLFCYQKAPYFYAPYNLLNEAYNGVKESVMGLVVAPYKIIRHPIDTAIGFYRTFFTWEGLAHLGTTLYNHPTRMIMNLITSGVSSGALGYATNTLWKALHVTSTPKTLLVMQTSAPNTLALPSTVGVTARAITWGHSLEEKEEELKQDNPLPTGAHSNELLRHSLKSNKSNELTSKQLLHDSPKLRSLSLISTNTVLFFNRAPVGIIMCEQAAVEEKQLTYIE